MEWPTRAIGRSITIDEQDWFPHVNVEFLRKRIYYYISFTRGNVLKNSQLCSCTTSGIVLNNAL